MKTFLYPRLAAAGMKRNARLYAPYLFTCVMMVAMEYIVLFLVRSPAVNGLPGTEMLRAMLAMGAGVVALFAAIFLFYTHSFLHRRRMKEFGLYNILGMGRWSLGWILIWETLIVTAITLLLGIGAGVALSKMAELVLVRLVQGDVTYAFSASWESVRYTAEVFGVIYAIILIHSLVQLHRTTAVQLMKSEQQGEKPPKANWFWGLGGVVVLGFAYWLAVSIEDPIAALLWFFVAVALVIVATYLLFISGSVLLCRILQRNRRYYYQSAHFVSVSSMKYRMRRNGAGLASICILGTMVLVSLSTSACLYIGSADMLNWRYPNDMALIARFDTVDELADVTPVAKQVGEVLADEGIQIQNVQALRRVELSGLLADGVMEPDVSKATSGQLHTAFFVPLDDYNQLMGTQERLMDGEAMIYPYRTDYDHPIFSVRDQLTLRVKKQLEDFPISGDMAMLLAPTLVVVVPEVDTLRPLEEITYNTGIMMASPRWEYRFDLASGDEQALAGVLKERLPATVRVDSRMENRIDYFTTFGGLLFLGIILSAIFLMAAVLIIYYKQISEGYEDQSRFAIMQKVGMTKTEIRKSINSQMLTVFLLPLLTAGLHLIFAFPMVRKLLLLFNLNNTGLLMATTAACFAAYAVFYLLVYRITSNTYFKLVSQKN